MVRDADDIGGDVAVERALAGDTSRARRCRRRDALRGFCQPSRDQSAAAAAVSAWRPVPPAGDICFGGQTTGAALSAARDLRVRTRILNPPAGTFHPKLYVARLADVEGPSRESLYEPTKEHTVNPGGHRTGPATDATEGAPSRARPSRTGDLVLRVSAAGPVVRTAPVRSSSTQSALGYALRLRSSRKVRNRRRARNRRSSSSRRSASSAFGICERSRAIHGTARSISPTARR